jgi:hypothetical protein
MVFTDPFAGNLLIVSESASETSQDHPTCRENEISHSGTEKQVGMLLLPWPLQICVLEHM